MALGLAQSWAQCLNQGFLDTGQQQFLQCSLVPIKGSESKANLSPRLSPSAPGEKGAGISMRLTTHVLKSTQVGLRLQNSTFLQWKEVGTLRKHSEISDLKLFLSQTSHYSAFL